MHISPCPLTLPLLLTFLYSPLCLPLYTQQRNIPDWLETLQMEEYTEVFRRAGYSREEDVENLKELNRRELNRMGVVKMGKLQ